MLKNLENKKIYILIGILFIIVFLTLFKLILKDTHAFYNESIELPLFNTKIGDFSGDGENVKQGPVNSETDINVIFYTQISSDTKKYKERKFIPVGGYVLNSTASNCYPAKGNEVEYQDNNYYKVNENGSISIKYSETKPSQVTCRLYYDIDTSNNNYVDGDISIYAFIEDVNGPNEYNSKKYKFTNEIDKSWQLVGHVCDYEDNITKFDYASDTGFKVSSVGPNVCFAYFKK